MRRVTVVTVVTALLGALLAAQLQLSAGQFFNNRPYPTYSLERMPDTGFSCRDKVLGGYYADSETQCQMFHICVKVAGLGVQDFRFLCPNGTAFDQDNQICADWDDVDCEAATLYYSSDNFDLYRVGSGLETAAFAGEDEATFHLQRSETGDARLNREHQSQRVNQRTDYNTAQPPRRPSPSSRPERERDILRASQSGNFYNNRNGGKEPEEDYQDDRQPNQNQDIPRKKVVRKFNNRKPVEEDFEPQTHRPQRPAGFVNNFAGSVKPSSTTLKPTTANDVTEQQYQEPRRTKSRSRAYSNAENFRNNDFNRNNQQVSTPAPFRAPANNNNNNNNNKQYANRQTTPYNQYESQNYPTTSAPKQNINNQHNNQASRQSLNNNQQPNFSNNQQKNYNTQQQNFNNQQLQQQQSFNNNQQQQQQDFDGQQQQRQQNFNNQQQKQQDFNSYKQQRQQNFNNQQQQNHNQQQNYNNNPSTAAVNKQTTQNRQPENYQTTPVKQQFNNYQTKQPENYPTTPVKQPNYNNYQTKQTEIYPSTPAGQNYYNKQPDIYTSTVAKPKQTENYPATSSPFKQTTQYKKETENYSTTAGFTNNKQYDVVKKTTQYKSTENYPTTYAPNKQSFQKATTQYYQTKNTENYPSNNPRHFTQQFNTQFDNNNNNNNNNNNRNQYQSSQQYSTTHRPTTQHTQYTPTVPKQTTQYYSTTPAARFSKQFDETQYDDGSYNPKYDDEKYKPDDEFLKTAHSQNFASARNELISSTKVASSITTQSPRPFSVTTPIPRQPNPPRQTQSVPKQTQPISKTTQFDKQKQTQAQPQQPPKKEQPKKVEKDVSYDYAYYDTNIGNEPDYDIGTEFAKSTKKTK